MNISIFSPVSIVQSRLSPLGLRLPENKPTAEKIQACFREEAAAIETFFDKAMPEAIRQVTSIITNQGSFCNGSGIDYTEIATCTSLPAPSISALAATVTARIDGSRGSIINEVTDKNLKAINSWYVSIASRRHGNRSEDKSLPQLILEQDEHGDKYFWYVDPKSGCGLKYYSKFPATSRVTGPQIGAPLIEATIKEDDGNTHNVWLNETAYRNVVYI